MDAPESEPTGSWLQRRGIDVAAWVLVIGAILGIAGGAAWYLSNFRLEPGEESPPYEAPVAEEPSADEAASSPPDLPTSVKPPLLPTPDGPGSSGPTWRAQPTPSFPTEALRGGQTEGEVRLTCVAEASGRLSQCRIIRETPAGYGFGANAVRAAEQARVMPRKINGVAMRSEITFNVRYRLEP